MNRRPVTTSVLLAGLLAVPGLTVFTFTASAAPTVTHATTRASVATRSTQANGQSAGAAISADGRYVAFTSEGTNLVAGDTNDAQDVFVRDRTTGATTRVSISTRGTQANSSSYGPAAISANGRYVAFSSSATNLVAGDTNGTTDVFVRDRVTGTTTRVSISTRGAQANGGAPAISADGRYVAFISSASNLVAGDTDGWQDVFVRDRISRTTTRASVATGGTQANRDSYGPAAISANGRYVAFGSSASNLVARDTNGTSDVFVRDRVSGTTTRASVAAHGTQGNRVSAQPAISANGRYVAFGSNASNLVAGDTNGIVDVFVRDRVAGATTRVDVSTRGAQTAHTDPDTTLEDSEQPTISADGRYVAFLSGAGNLVTRDTNAARDVFVRDRVTGTTTRVSVATAGTQANQRSSEPAISSDGRYVTFFSDASNLVAGDTNGSSDVFVRAGP
jgi:Tol biopolymer transport system component